MEFHFSSRDLTKLPTPLAPALLSPSTAIGSKKQDKNSGENG
jgi:hypothetical protein